MSIDAVDAVRRVETHPHGVFTASPALRGLKVHFHCRGISACQDTGFGVSLVFQIFGSVVRLRSPYSFQKYRITKDFGP